MARFERPRKRTGGGVWGFVSKFVSLLIVVAVIGFVGMFALQAETNRAGPSRARGGCR